MQSEREGLAPLASRADDGDETPDEAEDKEPPAPTAPPMWSPRWALWALVLVTGGFAVVSWPLFWLEWRLVDDTESSQVLAVHLLLAALAALMLGAYVALLDFRGRARTAEEMKQAGVQGIGIGDIAKSVPDALKAFGQLSASAALMVVALVLAGCATALAWHAGPTAGGTGTGTTSSTTTSSR